MYIFETVFCNKHNRRKEINNLIRNVTHFFPTVNQNKKVGCAGHTGIPEIYIMMHYLEYKYLNPVHSSQQVNTYRQ
jgi:hypothetical protein